MPSSTWVVVADSSAARIFRAGSPTGPLEEVESYAHAEGRWHANEMRTDEPGTTNDRVGYAKHGTEPRVSPKEHDAVSFARFINSRIEKGRTQNEVARLILVAPPEFLGYLRSTMDDAARKIVEADYNLNVVRMRAEDIRRHLPERLYSTIGS